ncbi:MAG: pH regulation protein F [Ectothiorhodospiraceae bacterium]|nr:pH regulation protein F [Ectothiorhodospiraceae bacterium]
MPTWVITVTYLLLCLALILGFFRLVRGPSLPDRVVALELIASITVGLIIVYAIHHGMPYFIDVALVLALTGFMAAVGFARYLERGGSRHE